ncbi:hypothetical protein AVEN_129570-1 [Araneus ventricosus]|uniref:Uncharacterized protein n=1 Tax=Araneus ventricosus TaxID=182803 RepID=A0A4Y2VU58_ARAVE|nr:hypothetical protein AVEN_129570-1 [Araneus ventricosus]
MSPFIVLSLQTWFVCDSVSFIVTIRPMKLSTSLSYRFKIPVQVLNGANVASWTTYWRSVTLQSCDIQRCRAEYTAQCRGICLSQWIIPEKSIVDQLPSNLRQAELLGCQPGVVRNVVDPE